MKTPADPLKAATTAATTVAAILALAYLGIFAWACPEKEFVFAIFIEVAAFVTCLVWSVVRTRSKEGVARTAILQELVHADKKISTTYSAYKNCVLVFLCALCLSMSIDLVALGSASVEGFGLSRQIYKAFPIWMCFAMHPGASAEVLAGADIKSGKYGRAEKLLYMIEDLRESIYGREHEMTVAIYADLGDFYSKTRRLPEADVCYRQSIALSKQIQGQTGYGRPLTGLANNLRDEGKHASAAPLYAQALSMRERIYGPGSTKVGETLEQFARLKILQGDEHGAKEMSRRAQSIRAAHRTEKLNPVNMLIMLISSWLAGYLLLGPKGVLTNLAVKILEGKISSCPAPSPADLHRLETLHAYQSRLFKL